jgi:hypothetical protein
LPGFRSSFGSIAPQKASQPIASKLVELVEDPRLDPLQDHAICVLNLPAHAGVCHGSPVDADVVLVTEREEIFPVNYVLLLVMMEFETPNQWMMS